MLICAQMLLIALAQAPAPESMPKGTLLIWNAPDGLEVKVNGELVGKTPIKGLPLAPGTYDVSIAGIDHVANVFPNEVRRLRAKPEVQALAPAPAPPKSAGGAKAEASAGGGVPLATLGYVAAGLGLLAAGGGIYFGLEADDLSTQARDLDRRDPSNSRADLHTLAKDAERAAFSANLLYGVGGVALISGAALIFFDRQGPFGVAVAPTADGVVFGGRF